MAYGFTGAMLGSVMKGIKIGGTILLHCSKKLDRIGKTDET